MCNSIVKNMKLAKDPNRHLLFEHHLLTPPLAIHGKCLLLVPVSRKNHHYLLVVMDYFTKWADTIPLRDQKATTIADAVIKMWSSLYITF